MDAGAVSWLTVGPLWNSLFTEATNARAIVAANIVGVASDRRTEGLKDSSAVETRQIDVGRLMSEPRETSGQ